uniref:SH2 domain-containing protein 4A-like n=1 Tax=Cyprinodon variegatus TaxID=28743 RepID=A0A3Q2DBS7_CYPVA
MLAQILEQMWVDPEVLEALSEEQKRILFLKMREEQVRRWRAREEKEEREGRSNRNTRPKKASSKQVSWLLSRDGEVSVVVIGEVDEFRSSKVLQNHMNNRLTDGTKCNQTVDLLPGSDAQQHSIKGEARLPPTDVNEDPSSPNNQSSEEDCSTDEDPKDSAEDSCSESGGSSENVSKLNLAYRPHFQRESKLQIKSRQTDLEKDPQQDKETLCHTETSENGGRVAQLRKAFADKPSSKPSSCNKPPLPVKPAHLQKRSTALVH